MRWSARFSVVLWLALSGAALPSAAYADPAPASISIVPGRISFIADRLHRDGRGGFYRAHLPDESMLRQPIPLADLSDVRAPLPTIEAVRRMLAPNRALSVEDEPSGLIRLRAGSMSTALGATKIHHLELSWIARCQPELAIQALLNASEVKAAMATARASIPQARPTVTTRFTDSVFFCHEDAPRLRGDIDGATFDEVLETIALTFHGLVVYVEAPRAHGALAFDVTFHE